MLLKNTQHLMMKYLPHWGWFCIGVFLPCLTTWAVEPFDHQYMPPDLPEMAVPAWKVLQNQGVVSVSEGALNVEVETNKRHFYGIGIYAGGETWGEGAALDMSSGVATIDFRLRCESAVEELAPFTLIVRDGKTQWQVDFYVNAINKASADTTTWDTYRVSIQNGLLQLSSLNRGVIFSKIRGTPDDRGNVLIFGTYSYQPESSDSGRSWHLKNFRWTNKEALTEPPNKE